MVISGGSINNHLDSKNCWVALISFFCFFVNQHIWTVTLPNKYLQGGSPLTKTVSWRKVHLLNILWFMVDLPSSYLT